MAGRVFYIDPLHGSSGYDGTTSADNISGTVGPFASITNVLWDGDSDPATYGASGDTFYLVASTGDVVIADDGYCNYLFDSALGDPRWAANFFTRVYLSEAGASTKFIGVNTDLEEDGTKYDILWDSYDSSVYNGGSGFFRGNDCGAIWRNVRWTSTNPSYGGQMYNWTSGGNGPYFIQCEFDWSSITTVNRSPLFYSNNPSSSFKDCTFLGPTTASMNCIRIGAQYGQHNAVIGCRFKDWNIVWQHVGGTRSFFYGNIVQDCTTGVLAYVASSPIRGIPIMNNLFYNLSGDAIDMASVAWTPTIMHNVFVDIGGYVLSANSGWSPGYERSWSFRRNVIQNATSGLYDTNVANADGGIYVGFTGENATYGSITENVITSGMTLSIDSDFNVTMTLPTDALGITSPMGSFAPSSAGAFLSSGTSGEGGGAASESEQSRVTA